MNAIWQGQPTPGEISELLDEEAEAAGATKRTGDDEIGYKGYATKAQVQSFVKRETVV